jgi:hypothetical protein
MRRFQLLVMLAALAAAVIWYSFYRARHTSSASVAVLLPKETLAFVHLPDFTRARADLHRTDLYQIWQEPAVQDFLQKPRGKIPTNGTVSQTVKELETLDMKDAFVALVTVENSAWKIVGGFRFKGNPGDAEVMVANWRTKLLGSEKDFKHETEDYQGHQIQTDSAGIVNLSTVRTGQWFFVANDREQLKPLLDRVDGRMKDPRTALSGDDAYLAAFKHMPSAYAALAYARVDQLVEKFMPSGKDAGASADQMATLRKIRGLCAATSFDGGKIRDSIFVGMPKLMDEGTLTRASLPIGTKETFLYMAGFLNLTKDMEIPGPASAAGWMGGLQKITGALSANGITLDEWKSAFGAEFGVIGDWPANAHWPSLFATLPVKDFAKANKILTTITTANPADAWTQQEKEGVHYFSTRSGGALFSFSPTIGLSNRMLVAGADADSVEAAMKRSAAGGSALADSKNFQMVERTVPTAQQAFAYLDPALIYARIDATVRPMLFMGAAFLPGIAETIDLNKLPAPEVITKHLSPIVMSQTYERDGYMAESIGPVTIYQTLLGAGALGGVAAVLYQNQSHGSMLTRNHPSPAPLLAPAILPSNSPSPSPEDSP